MSRRTFFFKNYVAHLILIVLAFSMAGGVFYYQMSAYALTAKQAELRATMSSLAEQTRLLLERVGGLAKAVSPVGRPHRQGGRNHRARDR